MLRPVSSKLFRLKTVGHDFMDTQLRRCLTTFDITLLGIGHMIGAGVYVLTGAVVKNIAGPGIVLSFLFAGIASLLSALCYAEFGARVPKAGSAYTYSSKPSFSYVTVGEFWAFIIGWNIILEHMLGAAAVARSWSGYLDSLFGRYISDVTKQHIGVITFHNHLFGDYPDLIALVLVLCVCAFMTYGAKTSTNFNMVFTAINLCVIAFVVIVGVTLADFSRWTPLFPPETSSGTSPAAAADTEPELDYGTEDETAVTKAPEQSFMPFGFSGVLAGAASCFFAYIGFDGLSTAAEEAKNPSKAIPRATFISMCIVSTCYILMSSTLTLMVDYREVSEKSAFSEAFAQNGADWAKYIVAIGALSGMTTSLCGSMFALPRCVYAMANDGLIFKALAKVNENTQVPTTAVFVFGIMTSVIALLFNIEALVEFLSIGTLMAYSIVSGSVIILRYRPPAHGSISKPTDPLTSSKPTTPMTDQATSDTLGLLDDDETLVGQPKPILLSIAVLRPIVSSFDAGSMVAWAVFVMILSFLGFGLSCMHPCHLGVAGAVILALLFAALAAACVLVVLGHHQSQQDLMFKVPYVPYVPIASIFINIMLMLHLNPLTWVRLVVWLAIGFGIYFTYGLHHSNENNPSDPTAVGEGVVNYAAATGAGEPQVPQPTEAQVKLERPQPQATK